jgi:hypothetical protein
MSRLWKFLKIQMLAVVAGGAAPGLALAADTGAVPLLELFTSQGCSSCPPADRLFEGYASRKDIVALSLPVDYWDYLGWKDTLANPKFTVRQRDYASRQRGGQVYTPQAVINGVSHVVGSDRYRIDSMITDAKLETAKRGVTIKLSTDAQKMQIEVGGPRLEPGVTGTIWFALVQRKTSVAIPRGENRGATVNYFNVVRELMPIGSWTGETTSIVLPRSSVVTHQDDGCAVFVQVGKGGPIVAAAWFE